MELVAIAFVLMLPFLKPSKGRLLWFLHSEKDVPRSPSQGDGCALVRELSEACAPLHQEKATELLHQAAQVRQANAQTCGVPSISLFDSSQKGVPQKKSTYLIDIYIYTYNKYIYIYICIYYVNDNYPPPRTCSLI